MSSGALGTAAWSTDPGHWRYEPLAGLGPTAGGRFLLLGENPNVGGFMHVRAPRQHMISIAPTRSGKGVSLIIPNLLTYLGSVLVVDPKGENAWITALRRRALGQKTFILDPWGEVNRQYGSFAGAPETLAHFNPLAILDPESDEYVDDITSLADALIISEGTKEPHWDDSARELVAGLMAFVVENPEYKAHASLGLVRDFLSGSAEQIRAIVEAAQKQDGIAKRKLSRFKGDTDEISGIMSNALTQTGFLDNPTLKRNLEFSDFNFEDLCGGNVSIYLVLPADKLKTYSRWLRLMVTVGLRAVARRGSQSPLGLPTLFVLDEFGTIGRLDAIAQAYGLMAGRGMILWAFAQDLNQLKRDYPHDWETFIGNSQAVTSFGVMDNFTTDYVSKMLGTSTVEQLNTSTTHGTSVGPPQMNAPIWVSRTSRSTSVTYSTATMSRPLLTPDEVRGLGGDFCIIMGNFPPILSKRIVYHQDWDFLHYARPDPHFPRTEEVRWRALQWRLREMGSVARLLKEYGIEVKRLRRGRYEVRTIAGKWTHIFASDNELWRWTYLLSMDGVPPEQTLPAGAGAALPSGSV
jgi:type IV secretion system protein VirD4